jgi:uncharacterized protein involved in outer membrane biogenesis
MKALKILVFLIVAAVIVVVGGGAALIAFSDPNDFKGLIADKVRDQTGRELALDGDLEWAFWPKLRLKAGPLSLSNAAGFGEEPMIAADHVEVAVATLPLLRERIEMDTIKLHGVVVNLAKNADGVTNWQDLAGEGGEPEPRGGGLASFVLGGVDIQDARLTWKDAAADQKITVSKLNVQTGALTFGDPIDFNASLTAVANKPALDGDVSLTGTVSYDLDDEHYQVTPLAFKTTLRGKHLPGGSATIEAGAEIDVNLADEIARVTGLRLSGLGTTVNGEFTATHIEDERPSARGSLDVDGKDLALIFNAFELPVGKQLAGISNRAFNFAAAFDANMDTGEATVSKLEGNLLGAKLSGGFNATKANTDKPVAKGNLSASGPDLPTLLAVVGQIQGADAETLKNLDQALRGAKDKSFAIDADLDADLGQGLASLPKLSAKLLGNTITGEVFATNADSDKPAVKGSLKANGPDLPTLLAVIGQFQGADAETIKNLNQALAGAQDKSFTVDADLDADLGKGLASLPKLNAKLLGNTVTGEVFATNADSDKPAVKGSLKASGPDLPSMIAVAAQFQADGKALTDMARSLAKEKDKGFNLEASFDTDLKAGRIDLPKLSADLIGLEIRGNMKGREVDFEKGAGSLDGELSVDGKSLGPLLRSVGQADLAKSVRSLKIDAGLKGSLSDLVLSPLTLTSSIAGEGGAKPVDLKVSAGTARANLDKETLVLDDLTVTGLGLNVKANIDAGKIKSEPVFEGNLDVPAFNLKKLLASLNKPVPKTAAPNALTSLGLKTRFSGTTSSIKLEGLKIALDKTKIQGDVIVADFEGPDLAFGIGIDSINADDYLEPTPKGKPRPATPEAAAGAAAAELPVDTLRALKIKGDLLIGDLVLSGAKMKNIKFSIRADGGKIKLDPLGAELYQGTYGGIINLDATGKQPLLGLNTSLKNVSVEPLIKDTVGNDMLSGIVSFDAAMNAVGGDGDRIKKSLNGTGKFGTTNGVFRGVDAVAVLRAVEQIVECKCPVPVPTKGGETRFSTLGGTLNVKNGVIRNEDLVLAGDGFLITGKGMLANLHDNTVKYDLKLGVTEARKGAAGGNYNLGGYTVPIQCRGAIENPSCLPDFGDIIKQVAVGAVKDKIGDKLKDIIPGDAGEALKNIFKF